MSPNQDSHARVMAARAERAPLATRRPPGRKALRGAVLDLYRRAILDAAEKVFEARGFNEAKMAEIAKAAGLAAGTLYNYFDSKEAIVRSLMTHLGEQMLARLEEAGRRAQGLGPSLRALAEAALGFVNEHRAVFSVFAQLGGPHAAIKRMCGPDAQRMRLRYGEVFRAVFQRAARAGELREGVSPDLAAVLIIGALQALVHGRAADAPTLDPAKTAAAVVDAVLGGVAAKPRSRA